MARDILRDTEQRTGVATAAIPKSRITVGTTSQPVLAANSARLEATICNDHGTNTVYLALGAAALVNQGIRLNAGGGNYTTPPGYTGSVHAVANGEGTGVTFTEI